MALIREVLGAFLAGSSCDRDAELAQASQADLAATEREVRRRETVLNMTRLELQLAEATAELERMHAERLRLEVEILRAGNEKEWSERKARADGAAQLRRRREEELRKAIRCGSEAMRTVEAGDEGRAAALYRSLART